MSCPRIEIRISRQSRKRSLSGSTHNNPSSCDSRGDPLKPMGNHKSKYDWASAAPKGPSQTLLRPVPARTGHPADKYLETSKKLFRFLEAGRRSRLRDFVRRPRERATVPSVPVLSVASD